MSDGKYGSDSDIFLGERELEELVKLEMRIKALENAARALRSAQRWYMSNRGNQEAGKAVAAAAKALDIVLGDA